MTALEKYSTNALKLIKASQRSTERSIAFQRLANYCAKSFNSKAEMLQNKIDPKLVNDEMFANYFEDHKKVLKDFGTSDKKHYKQGGIELKRDFELPDYEDLDCGIALIDYPPAKGKTTKGLEINKAFSRYWVDSVNFRLNQIAARSDIPLTQHINEKGKYLDDIELMSARNLTINMFSLFKLTDNSFPDFLLLDEFQYALDTFLSWGAKRNNSELDTINSLRKLKYLISKCPNVVRLGSHISEDELEFWKKFGRPITIYYSGHQPFSGKTLYRSKNSIEDKYHLEYVVKNNKLPLVVHTECGKAGIKGIADQIQQQYPELKIKELHKDNQSSADTTQWTSQLDNPDYKLPFDILITSPIFAIGTHCINKFKSQWGLFNTSLKKVGIQGMYQAFQRERQSMEYQWIRLSKGGKSFQYDKDFDLDFLGESSIEE